jgi:hypothetical protein
MLGDSFKMLSSTMRSASSPSRSTTGMAAELQPPVWRPLLGLVMGARSPPTMKWFVPRGELADHGCGWSSEGGSRAAGPCSSAVTPRGRWQSFIMWFLQKFESIKSILMPYLILILRINKYWSILFRIMSNGCKY